MPRPPKPLYLASASLALLLLDGCNDPATEPAVLDDADFPATFDNTPADNPMTPEGVALGRVLFYDTLLSQNATVSCASCHHQDHGFSDPERFSEGFDGGSTRRNSMPLINVRYYERGNMFWDERAATLEEQVTMPILDDVEMGLDADELLTRVGEAGYYQPLFFAAFGSEDITIDKISFGLAQFVRSIVSYQSRWDEAVAAAGTTNGDFATFTDEENRGKQLFFAGGGGSCASCHLSNNNGNGRGRGVNGLLNGARGGRGGEGVLAGVASLAQGVLDNTPIGGDGEVDGVSLFTIDRPRHNGLEVLDTDRGVFESTGDSDDIGLFKSPSLRNVEMTAPYMHDGRLATLEDVVEHYNSGIIAHENLDNRLTQRNGNQPRRLNLSDAEKAALVAFLKTLTDETIATNPRLSDPFSDGFADPAQ